MSGGPDSLARAVRGVARTRAVAPHLPTSVDGQLLLADAALLAGPELDALLEAIAEARLDPAAVMVGGPTATRLEPLSRSSVPVLLSSAPIAGLAETAIAFLGDESGWLARLAADLRLALAEAALAEPQPSAPAGLLAARLRRGVAVAEDGRLAALHARPAGQALAARFVAAHRRVLSHAETGPDRPVQRRSGNLWLLERRISAGTSVWLFDDLPLASVDEVGADALTMTLRALLRRPTESLGQGRHDHRAAVAQPEAVDATSGVLQQTLLAVARANGRVTPAARALGVHRNTVLYRLRRAAAELGVDPRRPDDALRILSGRAGTDGR